MTNPDTPPGEIWTMDDLIDAQTGDYLPSHRVIDILQEMARRIVALENWIHGEPRLGPPQLTERAEQEK